VNAAGGDKNLEMLKLQEWTMQEWTMGLEPLRMRRIT